MAGAGAGAGAGAYTVPASGGRRKVVTGPRPGLQVHLAALPSGCDVSGAEHPSQPPTAG